MVPPAVAPEALIRAVGVTLTVPVVFTTTAPPLAVAPWPSALIAPDTTTSPPRPATTTRPVRPAVLLADI